MEKVIIAGKPLDLTPLDKKELKGILVDTILELNIYKKMVSEFVLESLIRCARCKPYIYIYACTLHTILKIVNQRFGCIEK